VSWLVRAPWPLLLAALTCLAYAPSLGAGFLQYDDHWLVVDNPHFERGAWATPWLAFTDLSRTTRLELGAEYLPLRDVLVWLQAQLFGKWAPGMHAVSVLLYAAAALLLRGALLRSFGRSWTVELACLLFALHPVHVESVAWLAGQKDVLALLFVCAALYVHGGDGPRRAPWVALLVLCACLAKSMSVAAVVLLLAQDLVRRRRLDPTLYAATLAGVALSLAVHVHVGRVVGMVTVPAGGSRYTALITMGPVWLGYLALGFLPWRASMGHDVPDRVQWDAAAVAGYLVIAAWLALGVVRARRGSLRPAYTFLWFFGPLLPVSQVLAPLQNRMTDRYLWLSVLVPCLVVAWLLEWLKARLPEGRATLLVRSAGALVVAALFALTLQRSVLFTDDVLLFVDGTQRTEHNLEAPYQLAQALAARGDDEAAMTAYRETLLRARLRPGHVLVRRASNGLATLLARHGALAEAEQVLREALRQFPADPTVRGNLAKVLRGQGRAQEADAMERSGASREQ
jgi:hypothetical protein